MTTHGGKRPGAGRKPQPEKQEKIPVYAQFDPETKKELDTLSALTNGTITATLKAAIHQAFEWRKNEMFPFPPASQPQEVTNHDPKTTE